MRFLWQLPIRTFIGNFPTKLVPLNGPFLSLVIFVWSFAYYTRVVCTSPPSNVPQMRKNPSILLCQLYHPSLCSGPRLIESSGQGGKSYSKHGEFSSSVPPLSPDSQQDGTNLFPLHPPSLTLSLFLPLSFIQLTHIGFRLNIQLIQLKKSTALCRATLFVRSGRNERQAKLLQR